MRNDAATAVGKAQLTWRATFGSALSKVEGATWAAVSLTFTGWFLLDTLSVDWGPVRHRIHFYEVAAVIGSPIRLFTGLEGGHGLGMALFMLLCGVTLLAPATPYLWRHRFAWLAGMAPFMLMVTCALLLQARTSGDVFAAHGNISDTIGNDVRHLASHLIRNASASASSHVTLASGGYLALLSSLYLSARAISAFRNHASCSRETE
jgi:hypothetical protein